MLRSADLSAPSPSDRFALPEVYIVDFDDVTFEAHQEGLPPNILKNHRLFDSEWISDAALLTGPFSLVNINRSASGYLGNSYKVFVCLHSAVIVSSPNMNSVRLTRGQCLVLQSNSYYTIGIAPPFSSSDCYFLKNLPPILIDSTEALRFSEGYCYLHLFISVVSDTASLIRIAQDLGKYPTIWKIVEQMDRYSTNRDLVYDLTTVVSDPVVVFHVDVSKRISYSSFVRKYLRQHTFALVGGDNPSDFELTHSSENIRRVTLDLNNVDLLKMIGIDNEKAKTEFFKSMVNDRGSRFRNVLDESIADRIAMQFKKCDKAQIVAIPQVLSETEKSLLSSAYPEFDIKFDNRDNVSHAFAAASRKLETNLIFRELQYKSTKRFNSLSDIEVVDIGGNWIGHLLASRAAIHSCCPILDVTDDVRDGNRTRRLAFLEPRHSSRPSDITYNTMLRHLRTKLNRQRYYCKDKAQECKVPASMMSMIHSSYDMSLNDIGDAMVSHGARFLLGCFIFHPKVLVMDSGVIEPLGVHFEKTKEDITFYFDGESTHGYVHSWKNYSALIAKTYFTDSKKSAGFYGELLTNRNGVQFFSVSRLQSAVVPRTRSIRRIHIKEQNKVIVTYYKFDVRASNLMNAMIPITFEVDSDLHNKVLEYALRQTTDTKFNPSELFSYAVAVNSRVIVDGCTIMKECKRQPEVLFHLAHAVYIKAYVLRYADGRVDKAVLDGIKAERELGSTGIWGKLKLLIRTPFRNCSLIDSLGDIMSYWIVLPHLFPVSIEESVTMLNYDEVIEDFLKAYEHYDPEEAYGYAESDDSKVICPIVDLSLQVKGKDDDDESHSPSPPPPSSSHSSSSSSSSSSHSEIQPLPLSHPSKGPLSKGRVTDIFPPHRDLDSDQQLVASFRFLGTSFQQIEKGTVLPLWSVFTLPNIEDGESLLLVKLSTAALSCVPTIDGFCLTADLAVKDVLKSGNVSSSAICANRVPESKLKGGISLLLGRRHVSPFEILKEAVSHPSCALLRDRMVPLSEFCDEPATESEEEKEKSGQDDHDVVDDPILSENDEGHVSESACPPEDCPEALVNAEGDLVVQEVLEESYHPQIVIGECIIDHEYKPVPGDGSCFFHSIICLMGLNCSTDELRQELLKNISKVHPAAKDQAVNVLIHANAFAEPCIFKLVADHFNVNIYIHERSDSYGVQQVLPSAGRSDKTLCLLVSGNHVSPLVPRVINNDEEISDEGNSGDPDAELDGEKRKDENPEGVKEDDSAKFSLPQSPDQVLTDSGADDPFSPVSPGYHGCCRLKTLLDVGMPGDLFETVEVISLKGRTAAFFCSEPLWTYGHDKVIYINNGWPEWVKNIADFYGANSALVQRYDGLKDLPAHKDDEDVYDMGDDPVVTINVKGSCDFCVGEKKRKVAHSLLLKDGDVVLMPPGFQKDHYHWVTNISAGRISITLRRQKRDVSRIVPGNSQSPINSFSASSSSATSEGDEKVFSAKTPPEDVRKCDRGSSHGDIGKEERFLQDLFSNAQAYDTCFSSQFKELSPMEQAMWRSFRAGVYPSPDVTDKKVIAAVAELMEYWRIHELTITEILRVLYSRLREVPDNSFGDRHMRSRGIKPDALCVYDIKKQLWLRKPANGVIYECCFDGQRIQTAPRTIFPRGNFEGRQNREDDCEESEEELLKPDRYASDRIIFTKELIMCQSHRLYQSAKEVISNLTKFTMPEVEFIQGVPGCGKTTYIIQNHSLPVISKGGNIEKATDMVLTSTREGAIDLRNRIDKKHHGCGKKLLYRTMDSYLINGGYPGIKTLWVDEALMQHTGAIVLAAMKSGCEKVKLIGDKSQIPFISRLPDVRTKFHNPGEVFPTTKTLSVSYRCPVDVAAVLGKIYPSGMRSASEIRRSLFAVKTNGGLAMVPKSDDVHYLTFKQSEKYELISRGFKKVNTIHEFQGKEERKIAVVRLSHKSQEEIYNSMSHVLVALSRHREQLYYYSPVINDELFRRCSRRISAVEMQGASLLPDVPAKLPRVGFIASTPVDEEKLISCIQLPCSNPAVALQAWFDIVAPGESIIENAYDQRLVHESDLSISLGQCSIDTSRFRALKPRRPCLVPKIRTGLGCNRQSSVKESLLGLFKRNANVPELNGDVSNKSLCNYMLKRFEEVYVSKSKKELFLRYSDEVIGCSSIEIEKWLTKQPTNTEKALTFPSNIFEEQMDRLNFMIKNQVKPALDGSDLDEYKAVQTIAFNSKDINAVYCPIMRNIMDRLTAVLDDNFIINSQMSVDELASAMQRVLPADLANLFNCLEVDFSKYDKSQGELFYMFEKALYEKMGFKGRLADMWWNAHKLAEYKDYNNGLSAYIMYQRRSGDAATFLGNTVVLMAMLACLYSLERAAMVTFAGDDSLIFSDEPGLFSDRSSLAAGCFNMDSKFFHYEYYSFCSKFVLPLNGKWVILPDTKKLVKKLGRSDVVDYDHLEEYRMSLMDLCKEYKNGCVNEVLSAAVSERYPSFLRDHSFCFAAISAAVNSKEIFASLYSLPEEPLLSDPSRSKLQ